ncbi:MAG TPA: hypothetical protein VFZ11_05115 [Gemmatimonadaceae bacterium]
MQARTLVAALVVASLVPALAEGQQRRRQEPITIRGQVPTPQVVTVRPREVPTYQRNILVPNFYDRDFWAVILPAYLVVPERMVTGEAPLQAAADSMAPGAAAAVAAPVGAAAAPGDSAAAALPPLPPRPSRPFQRTTGASTPGATPATSPTAVPPAGASGTAPALPPR